MIARVAIVPISPFRSIVVASTKRRKAMTLADTIYERCVKLPDEAAHEALDFIDFLGQRYGTTETAPIGDDAVSYETWFKAQVKRALDDPRPGVYNQEVRQHFTHRRQALREKPSPAGKTGPLLLA